MVRELTEDEFGRALATFQRSAFRLETRESYALGYEREAFDAFMAGDPQPPTSYGWWKSWLDQIASLTAQGKTIGRVRILDEPPTGYQRSEMWADPWHAGAGERISYMTRTQATELHLPLGGDWWLLDDERLIVMRFTSEGETDGKTLITDPGAVAVFRDWRDLAVRNATPAAQIAAA